MNIEITKELLHELFIIDFDKGSMVRRSTGVEAGFMEKRRGYWFTRVAGHSVKRARLMYLAFYGTWPNPTVDHINRVTSDDRIVNLRQATRAENQKNRVFKPRQNQKLLPGVVQKGATSFRAQISVDTKRLTIGYFNTPEAAHEAYKEAKKRMYGEFAPSC